MMRTLTGYQLDRWFELIAELEQLPAEARAADIQVRRAKGVEAREVLAYVAFHFALPPEPAGAPQDDWCHPGAQIGSFILGNKLGVGGMGVVYRARQTTELMDRPVALKFIHPALVFTGKTDAAERFKREIQTLTTFDHEGIAQIYDGGMHTDPHTGAKIPFFAMRLIQDGVPLTRYAQEHDLTPEQRLRLFVNVCAALAPVHHERVIHWDLKPTNILVDRRQCPFVIDFGLARACDPARWHRIGAHVSGTLVYMSPEQVSADYRSVSQASDVYTLGVILYELLTGQWPYALPPNASRQDIRQAILTPIALAPLSQYNAAYPSDLDTIVAKMLAKDPTKRYPSAADCQQAIDEYLTQAMIRRAMGRALDEWDGRAKDVVSQPPGPLPKDPSETSPDVSRPQDAGMSQEQAVALCTGLHALLEAGQWKEADQETARVLLRLTKREESGWLREGDIKQLPCAVLRVMDALWQRYSDRRFGFSAQQRIWSEIEGQPGKFDFKSFRRFGDQVGWRVDKQWRRRCDEFGFTLDAPIGHLPSLRLPGAEQKEWWESWRDSFKHFLSRVEGCL